LPCSIKEKKRLKVTVVQDFEQIARAARREIGIDDRFCPDLLFVLDELKRLGRIEDYVTVPDEQMLDEASYDSRTLARLASTFLITRSSPN
jgi:hypothetical protein